jgi:hypothetical protein
MIRTVEFTAEFTRSACPKKGDSPLPVHRGAKDSREGDCPLFWGELTRSLRHAILTLAALAIVTTSGRAQPPAAPAEPEQAAPAAAPDEGDDAEMEVDLGDEKEARKKLETYRTLISKGTFASDDERKVLAEVLRWKMARFTKKKNREPPAMIKDKKDKEKLVRDPDWISLYENRKEIAEDVRQAGRLGQGKDVRPELLKAISKEAAGILEGYHWAARMNVAILLTEINSSYDPAEFPYVQASPLLIKIARDNKQVDAVRIWGVLGCRRLLRFEQTPAEVRSAIVKALTDTLAEQNKASKEEKREAGRSWLNYRLVEALGWSRTISVERRPVVPEVLAQVIIDTEHPWRPRYFAAQSIGRLPLDGSINLQMISTEIARLAQQVAREYEKDPRDPTWKIAAWRIYFAFRPEEDLDKTLQAGLKTQVDSKAALGAAKKPVSDAYNTILPIINGILKSEKLPKPAVDKLDKWLIDNTPKDYKVFPGAEPLTLPPDHAKVARAPGSNSPGN